MNEIASEHVAENRRYWNAMAEDWVAPGERRWAQEACWGTWAVPNTELSLLADEMAGQRAIELGCGTGYVSAWMRRRGAAVYAIDNSEAQLATARRLCELHGLDGIEWVHGNAETVPQPDGSFDFAISEYGAAIWCEPVTWVSEAHRLLRRGGELVLLGNHPLAMVCSPIDGSLPVTDRLERGYFDLGRLDWRDAVDEPGGIEFNLPISSWIRLFHDIGFDVLDYVEIRAPESATGTNGTVTADWARRFPSEQVWRVRKRSVLAPGGAPLMTLYALTGSTGHVGRRVAEALAGELPLRLVVRDASRAPGLPETQVRVATYGDRDASIGALRGVDALFMVSAAESATRREEHRTFIAAAAEAGVGHIVYTSFVGAAPDAVFTLGRDHGDAEVAIGESGMQHTLLRDNFYSDLLPYFADDAGVIRGPAGVGRVAAVARADVADVAVAVLRDLASHVDATYELTGPEALTMAEIAARAGAAIGRELTFHDETIDEAYASRALFGAEQWQLDAWVSTYLAIARGEVAAVSGDVERLTGHPARRLEEALSSGI